MPKKARKLKRKARGRSRGRSRRRNPANMVKPTPTAAQRLLDKALKAGVTSSADIKAGVGLKFPYHGEITDAQKEKAAKIAYREAKLTAENYLKSIDQPTDLSVHEGHKLAVQAWKDAKKAGADVGKRPPAPGTPAKSRGRQSGRAGNFKPMPKSRARSYLQRAFRSTYKKHGKLRDAILGKDKDLRTHMSDLNRASSWKQVYSGKSKTLRSTGFLGARIAEAINAIGAPEAGKILVEQKIRATNKLIKQNKAEQKSLERKLKKSPDNAEAQAQLSALQANLTQLEAALAKNKQRKSNLETAAAAARKRKARARSRARARMKKARARSRKARMARRSKKKARRRRR